MKVVLVNPQIPWNSGNIGRTCLAAGAEIVFVGKLGFKINSKEIRRSGLDYWPHLKYSIYGDFEDFLKSLKDGENLLFFSTKGEKNFWEAPYGENSCLVFGSESAGFPPKIREKYGGNFYKIPLYSSRVRSLNLSTSAGIAIYEAVRQVRFWKNAASSRF